MTHPDPSETIVNLGFRTDVALCRTQGATVQDRGDHLVVTTAANPGYYWGNFVLARTDLSDAERWVDIFHTTHPQARHVALGLDTDGVEEVDLSAYRDAGLEPEIDVVLSADAARVPLTEVAGIEVRRLRTPADWAEATAAALGFHPPPNEDEGLFIVRQTAAQRAVTEAGHGAWFGGFDGDRMIAGLGIFRAGPGLARYAAVDTAETYRRRGIAGALLGVAAAHAHAELGAEKVVIVADPEYHAITLYRRLGFADQATRIQLLREP